MNGPTAVSINRFHRSLAFRFTLIIGAAMLLISAGSTYLASVLEQRSLNQGRAESSRTAGGIARGECGQSALYLQSE